jgi:hypothetical protein
MSTPSYPLTLTGLSLAEAATKLDAQLPAEAYKPVPGGADLTDIDPNWMRHTLNEVFGLCGYGWGYNFHPTHIEYHNEVRDGKRGDRTVIVAILKHLEFWYRLNLGEVAEVFKIPATGNSENSTHAYALKGALTNAIGNAVSNIGFQQAVYLGKRDHRTVRAGKRQTPQVQPAPRAALPPAEDEPPTPLTAPVPPPALPPAPARNGHHANGKTNGQANGYANGTVNGHGRPAPRTGGKPVPRAQATPAPAPEPPAVTPVPSGKRPVSQGVPRRAASPAPVPEPPAPVDEGEFIVGFGRFRGRKVSTLTPNSLVWLANLDGQGLIPSSAESEQAQAAARHFLAAHPVTA